MFIDKMAYAREAFTNSGRAGSRSQYAYGRNKHGKPKYKTDEAYINFTGLDRVIYDKEYLRLTILAPRGNADGEFRCKKHYTNDIPEDMSLEDKDGNIVLWYNVEELYRELGGHAQ